MAGFELPNLQTHANTRCDVCGQFGLPPGRYRHDHCRRPPLRCTPCSITFEHVRDLVAHHTPDDEGRSPCARNQEVNR